jgi:NitT/TauT family transport system permease protein
MAIRRPTTPVTDLDEALSGLDALEQGPRQLRRTWLRRIVAASWPKLLAVGIVLSLWQIVVWTHWKPPYLLPGPGSVLRRLATDLRSGGMLGSAGITMRRVAVGYSAALVIGVAVGLAVSRSKTLRAAVGSLITGLQTMPSIAWFPLAILLFGLSEKAIFFVVVLGAAPAIANGLISGIDHIPPLLLRAGRALGATGPARYRHIVLPAALPGFLGGLKQGWAFAWRSLMAGELLQVVGAFSIGFRLQNARELLDAEGLMAVMIVILVIGVLVDAVLFGTLERTVRRRHGLTETA